MAPFLQLFLKFYPTNEVASLKEVRGMEKNHTTSPDSGVPKKYRH